ncbi:MAG TPA: DinB family protein [Acidimicrobiales bacterium]|nr:DinB family protein [Acidimicrobiales bacterium]
MDEFELLIRALGRQRSHVLESVDGLDDAALTTSVVPSGWTPAGMIQHLALDVEGFWFRTVFIGQSAERAGDPERAWDVAPGEGLAVIARYREECALADEVIAAHSPTDEPVAWPDFFGSWRLSNLYEMVLHVVTETACHTGHLDIARETIDGTQHMVIG